MSIKNIFKKKKRKKEAPKEIKQEIKKEEKIERVEPRRKPAAHKGVVVAPFVLEAPHIAEKPSRLMEKNQYVFKVYPRANKTEIKKAIEEVYGVDVLKVNIINLPKKRRIIGRSRGWRKGYKKAVVKVKEGQKIELLPR